MTAPAPEKAAPIPAEVERLFPNVDGWGALEWFDRLADAVKNQDQAVLAKDELRAQTFRIIAASSAMALARGHAETIRFALRADRAAQEERIREEGSK